MHRPGIAVVATLLAIILSEPDEALAQHSTVKAKRPAPQRRT